MSLAQSFVTLDHIAKGRRPRDRQRHASAPSRTASVRGQRVARLEALTILRLLWEAAADPWISADVSGGSGTPSSDCRFTADVRRSSSWRRTSRMLRSPDSSATAGCRARKSRPRAGGASQPFRRRAPRPSRTGASSDQLLVAIEVARAVSTMEPGRGVDGAQRSGGGREAGLMHPWRRPVGFLDLSRRAFTSRRSTARSRPCGPSCSRACSSAASSGSLPVAPRRGRLSAFHHRNAGASFLGEARVGASPPS